MQLQEQREQRASRQGGGDERGKKGKAEKKAGGKAGEKKTRGKKKNVVKSMFKGLTKRIRGASVGKKKDQVGGGGKSAFSGAGDGLGLGGERRTAFNLVRHMYPFNSINLVRMFIQFNSDL